MNNIIISLSNNTSPARSFDTFICLACCFLVMSYLFDAPRTYLRNRFACQYEKVKTGFIDHVKNNRRMKRSKMFAYYDLVEHVYQEWEIKYQKWADVIGTFYKHAIIATAFYSLIVVYFGLSGFIGYWNGLLITPPALAASMLWAVYKFNKRKLKKRISLFKDEIHRVNVRAHVCENIAIDSQHLKERLERMIQRV